MKFQDLYWLCLKWKFRDKVIMSTPPSVLYHKMWLHVSTNYMVILR